MSTKKDFSSNDIEQAKHILRLSYKLEESGVDPECITRMCIFVATCFAMNHQIKAEMAICCGRKQHTAFRPRCCSAKPISLLGIWYGIGYGFGSGLGMVWDLVWKWVWYGTVSGMEFCMELCMGLGVVLV